MTGTAAGRDSRDPLFLADDASLTELAGASVFTLFQRVGSSRAG